MMELLLLGMPESGSIGSIPLYVEYSRHSRPYRATELKMEYATYTKRWRWSDIGQNGKVKVSELFLRSDGQKYTEAHLRKSLVNI